MIHQVFLARFKNMDHPQSIVFLQQCCSIELDNKGRAKLPTKDIIALTFIQNRLDLKAPEYFGVFQLLCYHTDLTKVSNFL